LRARSRERNDGQGEGGEDADELSHDALFHCCALALIWLRRANSEWARPGVASCMDRNCAIFSNHAQCQVASMSWQRTDGCSTIILCRLAFEGSRRRAEFSDTDWSWQSQ
jgi:hypothetical protein